MLEWAAAEDRVVLSRRSRARSRNSPMSGWQRDSPCRGSAVIPRSLALAAAIRDLIALCRADPVVFADLALWLPLERQGYKHQIEPPQAGCTSAGSSVKLVTTAPGGPSRIAEASASSSPRRPWANASTERPSGRFRTTREARAPAPRLARRCGSQRPAHVRTPQSGAPRRPTLERGCRVRAGEPRPLSPQAAQRQVDAASRRTPSTRFTPRRRAMRM